MSNHLKNETSLYIKDYINTDIQWYPYGEKAFEKAKKEKRPIFLSIGYSGSYWCQIMKEESFQNKTIAKLLNDHFIAIKVDKDERTDVDKYYKQVYKLMNGQNCASPISLFLTEDQQPFYSATYIAPYPRGNVLGFEELLNVVIEKYHNDKTTMIQKGEEVLHYLHAQVNSIEATQLDINILNTIKLHSENLLDKDNGGFGTEPKFLHLSTLDLLLETYEYTQDEKLLLNIKFTLNKMIEGEIHDKDHGGFYHYANTKTWALPRQEKMIYDNAYIINILLKAYKIIKDENYKKVAFETMDFLLDQMYRDKLFYTNIFTKDKTLIIDTKIVTSFNAMAIKALFLLSHFDKKYLNIALKSLDTLLERVYSKRELQHSDKINAFLEDYAYLGETLLTAYKISNEKKYLSLSEEIANQAINFFYTHGKWKFSKDMPKLYDDIFDPLYPSSLATMLLFLHHLSFQIESDYNPLVFKTLEFHSYNLMRQPLSSPKMSKLLLRHLKKMI